ncbi:MAG: hypothetical protein JSU74_10765 [Candidatus Zixiibacteriota bacterium]|nr:MAG: hypothetical protein JSU74_10765 [candidate division Zixibacteria bacterium]
MHQKRSKLGLTALCLIAPSMLLTALFMVGCGGDDEPTSSSPTNLIAWPAEIADTSVQGYSNLDHFLVKVDCEPHANMDFSFRCSESWLQLSNAAGSEIGTTRDSFAVSFDVPNLPVGTYEDRIVITASGVGNSPYNIPVTYTVLPRQPNMMVEPSHLYFSATSLTDTPGPDTVIIKSEDWGNWDYDVDMSSNWLNLANFSGTTPDTVVVTVDLSMVTSGSHVDTLVLSSSEMLESPRQVPCSLYIPPWMKQIAPSKYNSSNLVDMVFMDDQNGLAIGNVSSASYDLGFIIGTTDGGDTWNEIYEAQTGGPGMSDSMISAIDAVGSDVWVLGQNYFVMRSSNMGDTWEIISTNRANDTLTDICFANSTTGWIVGYRGLILKSTDGGETWQEQTSGTEENLMAVHFVDESNGWAVGMEDAMVRTTDGGTNWEPMTGPTTSYPPNEYYGVYFLDNMTGWIVGKISLIAHTVDGGDTWTLQESRPFQRFNDVFFLDAMRGWAVGFNWGFEDPDEPGGVVMITEDGGATWTRQVSGTINELVKVQFTSDMVGWTVGNFATIRNTTSGGDE